MDRSKTILLDDSLGNENRILKVVTIPGHKGDAHVLAKGQLTHVYRRTVGQNVAAINTITHFDNRTLVDTGILVRALVLSQVVDVDGGFTLGDIVSIDTDNDTACINRIDCSRASRHLTNPRVSRNVTLHTRTH